MPAPTRSADRRLTQVAERDERGRVPGRRVIGIRARLEPGQIDASLKIVFVTSRWMEAQLVAGLLEGSGLKAFVLGAESNRMGFSFSTEFGDVKVAVPEGQADDALAVLREYRESQGLDPDYGAPFAD